MLQQTQVTTVIPFLIDLLKFTPINSLAKLIEEINKTFTRPWVLLQSKKSKKTAQAIIENFEGKLPNNLKDLLTLPGVGNYTAIAILAIAFNKPYIPLDGNIERVLKISLSKKRKEIQKDNLLQKIIFGTSSRSSDYAQALMELGALICKPSNPRCDECPIK